MTADDEERIVAAAAAGMSLRALAAEHSIGEGEVLAILDRAAEAWFKGDHLKRELLLEAERLSRLEEHYYRKALGDGEGAAVAGGLYVKLAERRAVLLGLNATPQSASIVIHQSMPKPVTGTDRIREALDRLREVPAPNGEADSGEP